MPTGGRVGPPTPGVRGSLYDFVRRYPEAHGGTCSRPELLQAIQASPAINAKLQASRGFRALPSNMRHSGDVLIEGETIRISLRALRRLRDRCGR